MKKVIVLSLGGSLIIPGDVDANFLKKFRSFIMKNTRTHKFVIVCGGGSIARKYITALKAEHASKDFQSFAGISATRMNARFMSYFFGMNQQAGMPHTMETLKNYIKNRDVVFCGALEYKPNQTSDSTATEIARALKTDFINITNVPGLFNKDPKKHKDAKQIPKITWKDFYKEATKAKFQPGQHFVLDQTASKMILDSKIPTYILGKDLKQLDNVLHDKPFKGTLIKG